MKADNLWVMMMTMMMLREGLGELGYVLVLVGLSFTCTVRKISIDQS